MKTLTFIGLIRALHTAQSMHQSNYFQCFLAGLPYKDISKKPENT